MLSLCFYETVPKDEQINKYFDRTMWIKMKWQLDLLVETVNITFLCVLLIS